MALIASGTICELREIKLSAKPAEMIAASPKGTVPVLVLTDNTVIDQSIDIMRWALGRNDPEGWLNGDAADLIAANDGPFKHHLDRYKYPHRHGADPAAHRAGGLAFLEKLDLLLSETGNLCGARISLADIAIVPFVRQFAATDRDWFDRQPIDAVRAWLDRLVSSPLFEQAMVKVPPWQNGDIALDFPTSSGA